MTRKLFLKGVILVCIFFKPISFPCDNIAFLDLSFLLHASTSFPSLFWKSVYPNYKLSNIKGELI